MTDYFIGLPGGAEDWMFHQFLDAGGKMELKVARGQGHNMWKGFFECQELVDFVMQRATGQEPREKEGR